MPGGAATLLGVVAAAAAGDAATGVAARGAAEVPVVTTGGGATVRRTGASGPVARSLATAASSGVDAMSVRTLLPSAPCNDDARTTRRGTVTVQATTTSDGAMSELQTLLRPTRQTRDARKKRDSASEKCCKKSTGPALWVAGPLFVPAELASGQPPMSTLQREAQHRRRPQEQGPGQRQGQQTPHQHQPWTTGRQRHPSPAIATRPVHVSKR
jgi:hypothetical protein